MTKYGQNLRPSTALFAPAGESEEVSASRLSARVPAASRSTS